MNYRAAAILAFAVCFWPIPKHAEASPVSSTLEKSVQTLADQYFLKHADDPRPSIGALPFNCSPELAKKGVGFAMSELMTHQLVQSQKFTVVERTEILKILGEQKLQQSGAIDAGTAAQIGKMIGAKFLVLGSVEVLGAQYQINTRLVRVENGEVMATSYNELPSTAFDETARPYLQSFPDEQFFEIYFAYNSRGKSDSFPVINASNGDTFTPEAFTLALAGGGLKYFPKNNWFVDASFFAPTKNFKVGTLDASASSGFPDKENIELVASHAIRLLVGYQNKFSDLFLGHISGGLTQYQIKAKHNVIIDDQSPSYLPCVQLGITVRPQRRIGINFALNYDLKDLKRKVNDEFGNQTYLRLPPLSYESGVSIYF